METKQKPIKNLKYVILTFIGIAIFIVFLGCFIFLTKSLHDAGHVQNETAYEAGRSLGRLLRKVFDFIIKSGFLFGSIIAIIASLEKNKSAPWAILHGFLSWIYVVYYAITRKTITNQ